MRSLRLVDDDSCERALSLLRGPQAPRYGLWVFYAAGVDEATAATRAFNEDPIDGHYFTIRSGRPLVPRALVRLGLRLRTMWKSAVPANRRVDELLIADRQLLAGRCVPYGDLGDPDISPHWPPVKTTHQ